MGRRGPPPTPTAILELRGSWRAKTRPGEPPALPVSLRAPREMDSAQRKVWRRVVPKLSLMRVLSDSDLEILAIYCDLRVVYDHAKAIVLAKGTAYTEKDGDGNLRVKSLPQFEAMMKLAAQMLAMQKQLGMTPAARACLNALPRMVEREAEEPQDRFIGAGL